MICMCNVLNSSGPPALRKMFRLRRARNRDFPKNHRLAPDCYLYPVQIERYETRSQWSIANDVTFGMKPQSICGHSSNSSSSARFHQHENHSDRNWRRRQAIWEVMAGIVAAAWKKIIPIVLIIIPFGLHISQHLDRLFPRLIAAILPDVIIFWFIIRCRQ